MLARLPGSTLQWLAIVFDHPQNLPQHCGLKHRVVQDLWKVSSLPFKARPEPQQIIGNVIVAKLEVNSSFSQYKTIHSFLEGSFLSKNPVRDAIFRVIRDGVLWPLGFIQLVRWLAGFLAFLPLALVFSSALLHLLLGTERVDFFEICNLFSQICIVHQM